MVPPSDGGFGWRGRVPVYARQLSIDRLAGFGIGDEGAACLHVGVRDTGGAFKNGGSASGGGDLALVCIPSQVLVGIVECPTYGCGGTNDGYGVLHPPDGYGCGGGGCGP